MGVEKCNLKMEKHSLDCVCVYALCKTAARAEMGLFSSLHIDLPGMARPGSWRPAPLCPAPPQSQPHLRAPGHQPPGRRRRAGARAPGADSRRPAETRFVTLAELSPWKSLHQNQPSRPEEVLILVAFLPFIFRRVRVWAAEQICSSSMSAAVASATAYPDTMHSEAEESKEGTSLILLGAPARFCGGMWK